MAINRFKTDMIEDRTSGQKLSSLLAEKANKKSNIVYVSDLLVENPTTPIATVINQLFLANKTNGIKVIVDTSITINSTLTMQSNCTLEGSTRNIQITLANGSNCDMVDWNYAIRGLIRNLTFNGNKSNNTSGNGIVCGNASRPVNSAIVDGSLIENVDIWECVGDGLQVIYPIWVINFNRIRIGYCNGYGLYNTGTDNFFNDFYIMSCGKIVSKPHGMYFFGGNNKLSNSKVIFSGLANTDNSVGVIISGSRQQITNVESQENLNGGFHLYYLQSSNVSVLADSNADKVAHVNNAGNNRGFGIKMTSCTDNVFNITSTNFTYSSGYYHDIELLIDTGNQRNTISYNYQNGLVKTPIKDTWTTPETANVINGYSLITYNKTLKTKKTNMVTEPIPQASSTFWSLSGGATVNNGLITATNVNQGIIKNIALTSGKTYLLRIDLTSITGNWYLRLEESVGFTSPLQYDFSTSKHLILTTTANENRNLLIRAADASGGSINIAGVALVDITDIYANLSNYYGNGTIGKLLATEGLNGSTITL